MKLSEIAHRVGGTLSGDGAVEITAVAPIEHAAPGEITLLSLQRYTKWVPRTRASAIITSQELAKGIKGRSLIICEKPYEAFAIVLHLFTPEVRLPKGISERATIATTARIGDDVAIMPGAFVDDEAFIGRGTVIYPNVFVGHPE